jgi:Skp family chaperone for outer membrane proteins
MANEDVILKEILQMGKTLGSIETKLENHDELFVEIRNDIKTIVSKQNEDMVRFVSDKEKAYKEFNDRLEPLENDFKKRSAFTSDVKKKSWDTIWDWLKIGVVFMAGYLLTLIKNIK